MASSSEADAWAEAPPEVIAEDRATAYGNLFVMRDPNRTLPVKKIFAIKSVSEGRTGTRLHHLLSFNDPAKSKTRIVRHPVAQRAISRADRGWRTSLDPRRFERPRGVALSDGRRRKE